MSIDFAAASKARSLRDYFSRHGRIYIVVDATRDDVVVPHHLHGDPALRLVLNVRMPQPIFIRDDAVESDFSFSGRVLSCRIPIAAIWAAYRPDESLEQGIVWEDSIPETIRVVIRAVMEVGDQTATAEEPAASEEQSEPLADTGRRHGHLRVIK